MTPDGRYVVFSSWSNRLVPGDTNNKEDVFVRDLETGVTSLVSAASDSTQGDFESNNPGISADGRFVAFASKARNLVPGDTNGRGDLFIHDRMTGETSRVPLFPDAPLANGAPPRLLRSPTWSPRHRRLRDSSAAPS